ncbi:DUF4386 domain-containing protein [Deinococcus cellulosilyticus]|uniref:DUF4386 domain-containing protein n=1 Tax=Deinococcus cellulosilyticus (strain DSM 18568 / NBRC 106333 / KACC 11606 / 5516J-15) TaxID=1223518 RepID=A0A511N0Z2_DEIC1|nr:DUF4386 domain-containing protein [Deinococcus cellulosilyticus]GEM46540.1 hypothetical protein DC3_21750 [Deinococcus cellulosilyticus NBRC 106333 = KACC 11606]
MTTLVAEQNPTQEKQTRRWVGIEFLIGAMAINIPYMLLIQNFNYPDILRESPEQILSSYHALGSSGILTWMAFAWLGFPMLLAMIGLHGLLKTTCHPLLYHATAFGILAALLQMVGLLRWVFVNPVLADLYVSAGATESTRAALTVVFQAIHQYGGVLLGEHLGQVFTVLWMWTLSLILLQTGLFPRWLGMLGFVAGGVYLLAQLELLHTVIPAVPVWEPAGLIGSLMWLIWVVLLGIQLLRPAAK